MPQTTTFVGIDIARTSSTSTSIPPAPRDRSRSPGVQRRMPTAMSHDQPPCRLHTMVKHLAAADQRRKLMGPQPRRSLRAAGDEARPFQASGPIRGDAVDHIEQHVRHAGAIVARGLVEGGERRIEERARSTGRRSRSRTARARPRGAGSARRHRPRWPTGRSCRPARSAAAGTATTAAPRCARPPCLSPPWSRAARPGARDPQPRCRGRIPCAAAAQSSAWRVRPPARSADGPGAPDGPPPRPIAASLSISNQGWLFSPSTWPWVTKGSPLSCRERTLGSRDSIRVSKKPSTLRSWAVASYSATAAWADGAVATRRSRDRRPRLRETLSRNLDKNESLRNVPPTISTVPTVSAGVTTWL